MIIVKKFLSDFKNELKSLDIAQRKNLFFIASVLFTIMFSYQMIRSTATAIFFDSFGAKNSPYGWIFSIIVLILMVSLYNRWQLKLSIHKLFLFTSIMTFIFFIFCLLMKSGYGRFWAAPIFVWKEVYIVLLVHMTFGFLNNSINVKKAKLFYGPFGAICGIGGTLGGFTTSKLTHFLNTEHLLIIGCICVLLASLLFWFTDHNITLTKELTKKLKNSEIKRPLDSIADVKEYVFLIALLIAISQVCISIAHFKFNIFFDQTITDKLLKTRALGNIYSCVSFLSLLLQLLAVPIVLKCLKTRTIHMLIPILFLVVAFLGFGIGGHFLVPVTISFIVFKGVDYSLFGSAKEILYFPLTASQKYGAKYISDMVVYRFAKGAISLVLVFVQSTIQINLIFGFFLLIWPLTAILLFISQSKLPEN